MGKLLLALAVVFIFANGMGLISKAHGQEPQCGERDQVHELLAKKFKEVPIAMGVTNTGGLIEVLTSKTGSWTMLLIAPSGKACLVAAGEGWRTLEWIDPEGPRI